MARTPKGKLLATFRQEASVLTDLGMYRRVQTFAIHQMPDGAHELHLGERFIGGKDQSRVERFDTFFAAYEWVGRTYNEGIADALIDAALSLTTN